MTTNVAEVGRGRTVLIVEDNARSRRLVKDLLELHGFATVDVDTAEDGLAAAEQRLPDLILLDVQLPGMDGVQTLRALRSGPATAQIPVIAVTAYAMRGDEERFMAEGFDAYISKPIDVRSFVPRLRAVLGDQLGDQVG